MPNFELIKSHIQDVERDIRPPMASAITLPVLVDGKQAVVYVCTSPFLADRQASREQLIDIAERLMISKSAD